LPKNVFAAVVGYAAVSYRRLVLGLYELYNEEGALECEIWDRDEAV